MTWLYTSLLRQLFRQVCDLYVIPKPVFYEVYVCAPLKSILLEYIVLRSAPMNYIYGIGSSDPKFRNLGEKK